MRGIARNTETYIDDRFDSNTEFEQTFEQPKKPKEHKLIIVGADNIQYKQLPRVHGAVKHKLTDKYKNPNPIELEFLKCANSRHSFISSYFNHFGFGVKSIDELEGMWKRREDILEYMGVSV